MRLIKASVELKYRFYNIVQFYEYIIYIRLFASTFNISMQPMYEEYN